MGRNTVNPSYQSTFQGHPPQTPALERPAAGALDIEWNAQQIRALAHAIDRYFDWQERQVELRESRRTQRAKSEAAA